MNKQISISEYKQSRSRTGRLKQSKRGEENRQGREAGAGSLLTPGGER